MNERRYLCIDLKSFYASVECVMRGLNPITTNLVVADTERTEKTICLAVTPALKEYKIPGRARLFEVIARVKQINEHRKRKNYGKPFEGKSTDKDELEKNPRLELDYIAAPPRMALYIRQSAEIYGIYLKYVAPEDIHIYSIDEVFMDITDYLKNGKMSARQMAETIIKDVFSSTGITATAGIGTNMYLAKVAMDIVAKKIPPDKNGVRIAELDEMSYRRKLWEHRPLTDFWRVGAGYSKKLEENNIRTMGDIARASLSVYGENLLYRLFGVNAELLIDHAWGVEPCRMEDIKAYKPENRSLGMGQVLHCPYDFEQARLIVKEMTELLALDLTEKNLLTDRVTLTVGYDKINAEKNCKRETVTDFYGRKVPKHAHGTVNIGRHTASAEVLKKAVVGLFENISDSELLVRRVNISAGNVMEREDEALGERFTQYDFFGSDEKIQREKQAEEKEKKLLEATVNIRKKYGKNAVVKGINLKKGATTIERNRQIGGHKA